MRIEWTPEDLPTRHFYKLLQGVILSKRPFTSGAAYRSIWNNERNESPLLTITLDLTCGDDRITLGEDEVWRWVHEVAYEQLLVREAAGFSAQGVRND